MSYGHLSLAERHYIEIERKAGTSMNQLAKALGRSQSTVSFRQGCVTADSPDCAGRLSGQWGLSGT